MTQRPSAAHGMARTCIAGLTLVLLALPAHKGRSERACAAEGPVGAARDRRPGTAQHAPAQCDAHPAGSRHVTPLPAGIHPIGISGDGEPYDTRRQPAAALVAGTPQ